MTSNIIGKVKSVSSKIMWEIDKSCMNCNVGSYVESPRFGDDIQWYLRLYPKGTSNDYKEITSIYLLAKKHIDAMSNFKIFNDKAECVLNYTMQERTYYSDIYYYDNDYNHGIVMSRDFIMNPSNGIISGDKIIIACEVTMSHPYEQKKIKLREIEEQKVDVLPQLKALQKYEALLIDSKYSDVCLISEGKPVKVHKCILAKSSPVFAAMFDAEMKEKQENIVEIDDIKYYVLVEMVRFIYSGKLKNVNELAFRELAAAADKYGLDGLKKVCEKSMSKNLSLKNAFTYLDFADRLRMNELKEKTIEFMSENASDITETPEFDSLPSDILRRICRGMAKKRKLC